MKWRLYGAREFDRFRVQWDEVNASASGNPLLSSDFAGLLLREFGSGDERIGVCEDGGRTVGVALLTSRRGLFWETFQPSQAPLGMWVHAPNLTLESLARSLLRALPGFALTLGVTQQDPEIEPRPRDSATIATIDYISTARLTISESFDEYWAARGKNLRSNTKRQLSRLEKEGKAPRLQIVTDAAGVAGALHDYGKLESVGWKGTAGTAIHPDNAQGRFYRALLESHCGRGAGRIYRYLYDDAVVATDLCIENRETLIVLKTTYDESIRDSSPASLLRHAYFRHVFEEGRIRRIEFYGKVMEWHTRLTDEIRTMYHANIYRSRAVARLRRMLAARTVRPGTAAPTPAEQSA